MGTASLKTLRTGSRLNIELQSVLKYNNHLVDYTVSYLLSPTNVSFLSRGTRKLLVDGHYYVFPQINRKQMTTVIYENYKNTILPPNIKHILHMFFLRWQRH